ncbi:5-oxoprolinase subunit C family protein [Salimicrobium album]|uniref:Antagonist of KipI n=1 Tax=Salimicrobium album TaxID=50717 RepID=A0A1H3HDD6_9BACI|nr:biotin-dependent carboxyltransferase family protein [Salimicrobium album]SDY13235.1 antagonist of KipI [Salimicrobium album]
MIQVQKAGLLTTIQDAGRRGYQKYGASPGGAADTFAYRLANIAVGNEAGAAVLEMTLQGDVLLFEEPAVISITGADMKPEINGERVPMWRPVYIDRGETLHFSNAARGIRTYVAIAGGFVGENFLGSFSTYLSMKAGGHQGRKLEKGDVLSVNEPSHLNEEVKDWLSRSSREKGFTYPAWRVPGPGHFREGSPGELRAFPGRHYELFDAGSKEAFETERYKAGSKSDRMGVRLDGVTLTLREPQDILSEPVTFGTVQVPSNGEPIILLADRQTTGGYPKIAQIISVDCSKAAQLRPGEAVSFRMITHPEAEQLLLTVENRLALCEQSVKRKIMEG